MKLSVIKIGGNIVDNPEALDSFLKDFAAIDQQKILVHGGGKVATQVSKALGIETQMVEGRRITDEETLKVVTMVYAGLVNKTIVSKLQGNGCNAIGLTGADGNAIQSHKRTGSNVDYGFVADVDKVNATMLEKMLDEAYTPVMAPITHDKKGLLLNTNADTIASEVATAMSDICDEVQLIYCFELPGVLKNIADKDSVIEEINTQKYQQLKADGIIADGMIPKMDNCYNAIRKGVSSVRICHAQDLKEILETGCKGTKLISFA